MPKRRTPRQRERARAESRRQTRQAARDEAADVAALFGDLAETVVSNVLIQKSLDPVHRMLDMVLEESVPANEQKGGYVLAMLVPLGWIDRLRDAGQIKAEAVMEWIEATLGAQVLDQAKHLAGLLDAADPVQWKESYLVAASEALDDELIPTAFALVAGITATTFDGNTAFLRDYDEE